nr:immunoglobulin heavy chain junction region [Macaca mulatta]MOV42661.1 immunoglobulin heavy chain junction region [Macaca mulatta]MOV46161.1 immunoglobulin heavy chain junction region [Macaca mulatta]
CARTTSSMEVSLDVW